MDKKQLRNTLMLMACAFIWGTAFVAQSVGSDYMGPYTFLASRSWLACAFLLGLMAVLHKMGKTNPAAEPGFWQNKKVLLRGGIFCGVALFAASAAQQMGIGTTSTQRSMLHLSFRQFILGFRLFIPAFYFGDFHCFGRDFTKVVRRISLPDQYVFQFQFGFQ